MIPLFEVPHCVPWPFRSQAILNDKKLLENLLGNSIQRKNNLFKSFQHFSIMRQSEDEKNVPGNLS